MLSWLRRRAGRRTGRDPACRGSARAPPAEHPLGGPRRPLPLVRPAGPAPPPRADLRCAGGGGRAAGPAGGGAGGLAQQGAGGAGRQDRQAVGPARVARHPWSVTGAVARAARRAQPTYQSLTAGVRASPVVAPDETGWRVGGAKAWLWAFVGDQVTVYRVACGRGYQDATEVLGEDYAGVLERDGWAPYRRFAHARHQSCLAHLLRRCRELVADADRGQARTPHAVRRILEHALTLRDAHHADAVDAITLVAEADRLGAQVDKLVAGATR